MRYVLFIIIIAVTLCRYIAYNKTGKDTSFLWVSLYIQLTPLACILIRLGDLPFNGLLGAFDSYFSIDGLWIICILIILLGIKKKKDAIEVSFLPFIICLILFEIISLFNENNTFNLSGLPIGFRLLQIIVILKFVLQHTNKTQIINGLWDGFKNAIILQFILTLMFPVLGLEVFSSMFWETGAEWGYRRDTASALGTFMHPGVLALFACMASFFFFSCFLYGIRKSKAIKYILVCAFIIIFTYSRTSYVILLGLLVFLYIIFNRKSLSKSILIISCFIGVVLFIAYYAGVFDLFIASDFTQQQESRLIHFMLALDCFKDSPIIGVGINNHVNYMSNDLINSNNLHFHSFYYSNPFHNTHLIILAETGLCGFIIWCYSCLKYISKAIYKSASNIMSLIFLGVIMAYVIYGMSGWGPFHKNIYPILILIWSLGGNSFNYTLKDDKFICKD